MLKCTRLYLACGVRCIDLLGLLRLDWGRLNWDLDLWLNWFLRVCIGSGLSFYLLLWGTSDIRNIDLLFEGIGVSILHHWYAGSILHHWHIGHEALHRRDGVGK